MLVNTIAARVSICSIVVALCATPPAAAQDLKAKYPSMPPIDRFLMADRNAEISIARSAAPKSISGDATVLVLGRHGYETAVKGTNGFVCLIDRSWTEAIDFAEVWNPHISGPLCLNPPAVGTVLPAMEKKTALLLAGDAQTQIIAALKQAYHDKQLPPLEPGAMSYMMSKQAYLTDAPGHNLAHLMFYVSTQDGSVFGSDLPKSPFFSDSYWYPNEANGGKAVKQGLPQIPVIMIATRRWSDGTPQLPSH